MQEDLAILQKETNLSSNQVTELYNARDGVTGITDSIGGLNALYVNGPTSDTTNGVSLDGDNDHVSLQSFQFGGTFSFEMYFKINSYNIWDRFLEVYRSLQKSSEVFLNP